MALRTFCIRQPCSKLGNAKSVAKCPFFRRRGREIGCRSGALTRYVSRFPLDPGVVGREKLYLGRRYQTTLCQSALLQPVGQYRVLAPILDRMAWS